MRSISIPTTQNVTIEYELAGSMSRIFAFFIDGVIVLGTYLLFVSLFLSNSGSYLFIVFYLPLSLFLLYYFCCELFFGGQTAGKRVQGLKVIRADGKQPTPGDFLVRTIFLLPDVWFSLGVPAVLLINTTPRAQRLGDIVAHTVVIRVQGGNAFGLSDILSIQSKDDYEPRFPAIQHFSEQDMLLLKETLTRAQKYNNAAHHAAVRELAGRCREQLDIAAESKDLNAEQLLRHLLRDYIVLTR
ncbi:MAG: RDD family protein [Bacteroidota bacterium]